MFEIFHPPTILTTLKFRLHSNNPVHVTTYPSTLLYTIFHQASIIPRIRIFSQVHNFPCNIFHLEKRIPHIHAFYPPTTVPHISFPQPSHKHRILPSNHFKSLLDKKTYHSIRISHAHVFYP